MVETTIHKEVFVKNKKFLIQYIFRSNRSIFNYSWLASSGQGYSKWLTICSNFVNTSWYWTLFSIVVFNTGTCLHIVERHSWHTFDCSTIYSIAEAAQILKKLLDLRNIVHIHCLIAHPNSWEQFFNLMCGSYIFEVYDIFITRFCCLQESPNSDRTQIMIVSWYWKIIVKTLVTWVVFFCSNVAQLGEF